MTDQSQLPLPIIQYFKLASGGPEQKAETEKLLSIVQDLGFFYLDLQSNSSTDCPILEHQSQVFEIAHSLFNLPAATKNLYDVKTNGGYFGYKGVGKSFVDPKGTPDLNEFYNISKDDMLSQQNIVLAHPTIMQSNRPLFASFIRECHDISHTLLSIFSRHLCQDPKSDTSSSSTLLPNLHRLAAHSGDQISLIKYPVFDTMPDTQPLASHTDYGSLTILFTSAPGLQVQKMDGRGKAHWMNVDPKQGCAIVNCGDALSIFTAGRIRSNLHRVQSHVARNSKLPRYSVGYFCRPEDEVLMCPLPEFQEAGSNNTELERVKSKDWVMRRSYGRLLENFDGESSWQRTRGTEV